MIQNLELHNHKIVKQIYMEDLGHINIICGKNNSGKTTIFEAMMDSKCYGVGKNVEDIEWMIKVFSSVIEKYNIDRNYTMNWFKGIITELSIKKEIWYESKRDVIIQYLEDRQKKDRYLWDIGIKGIYNDFFSNYFNKTKYDYVQKLVPPKRHLKFQTDIELDSEILMEGEGILNRIFYLKNQDPESIEYKKYLSVLNKFESITGSRFNIVPSTDNQIKLVFKDKDSWIDASDSGLGLTDIFIIVSLVNLLENNIFLIEEPENHLHAEFQKKLLSYFQAERSKQFFISTHSAVFLDPSLVDKIFYCQNNGEISVTDQTSKSKIINSLGYSVTDNLISDLIILLEGPTDIPIIQKILSWNEILDKFNIKYWPLGGDIMACLDLSVFAERKNVFALVDSDPGSGKIRTKFLRNCKNNGIYAKQLTRYSIENYFTLDAIREVFPNKIKASITNLDPNESVDKQIGFKINGEENSKSIKSKNGDIISRMKPEDIQNTDLQKFVDDVVSFLNKT